MINTKANILYISYDGMTDPLGQSQVLPYLAGLAKEYSVHLISFEKVDRYAEHKETILTICKENNIKWYPLEYTKNPPIFSGLYDICKMHRLAKQLDELHDFKLIHCRSYISALVGLKFKRKTGKKFVFDMRGFWADERVDGGIWNLKNPIYKWVYNYFKKKEKQFFSESDAIVSLTENGKNEILSWNLEGVTADKITVIPCCVNVDLFAPKTVEEQKREALKEELGIDKDDFVLGYVGSIGTWYMLPEMLDYFVELQKEKQNAKFLFLSSENPDNIFRLANEKGIANEKIIITKSLHSEVPSYISLFDVSIFFILPVFSKKASSPTKQGELMSMGIPVVCNTGVGDTDHVVNMYRSGVLVTDFTTENYQKNIQTLTKAKFDIQELQQGASEFYGLDQGINNYLTIYETLLNG